MTPETGDVQMTNKEMRARIVELEGRVTALEQAPALLTIGGPADEVGAGATILHQAGYCTCGSKLPYHFEGCEHAATGADHAA